MVEDEQLLNSGYLEANRGTLNASVYIKDMQTASNQPSRQSIHKLKKETLSLVQDEPLLSSVCQKSNRATPNASFYVRDMNTQQTAKINDPRQSIHTLKEEINLVEDERLLYNKSNRATPNASFYARDSRPASNYPIQRLDEVVQMQKGIEPTFYNLNEDNLRKQLNIVRSVEDEKMLSTLFLKSKNIHHTGFRTLYIHLELMFLPPTWRINVIFMVLEIQSPVPF